MVKENLGYKEKEALKEKSRKKMQALLNYGFVILSDNRKQQYNSANEIATDLENNYNLILTIPDEQCICLQFSDMAFKLLKSYLKDVLMVGQLVNKTNYLIFKYNVNLIEQLTSLAVPNDDIQLVNTFEINFNKYTMPAYTNKAKLYSVSSAPVLTPKEIDKILSLHQTIINNKDNYFLLSNNINHAYNMPMTILRKLGENVISLNALNLLELIMIYASNSSAIYRQPTEAIKPFVISADFFKLADFNLGQTKKKIANSLIELQTIT